MKLYLYVERPCFAGDTGLLELRRAAGGVPTADPAVKTNLLLLLEQAGFRLIPKLWRLPEGLALWTPDAMPKPPGLVHIGAHPLMPATTKIGPILAATGNVGFYNGGLMRPDGSFTYEPKHAGIRDVKPGEPFKPMPPSEPTLAAMIAKLVEQHREPVRVPLPLIPIVREFAHA